ncbi:HAD hydrolase-like protein, partial [Candidatus Woesearchaeota archaeon]|nr:HAD hydrolase-like protein [Candidatus Woesearchaeota archaeon]
KIYGAPYAKSDAINEMLRDLKIEPKNAIMLGDSESDYKAAEENNVLFLLRSTKFNKNLQDARSKDYIFKDFINE